MKNFLKTVVLFGIAIRFALQFFYPCFNVDEMALGSNIVSKSFAQLLYPLDCYQSAPPLFLWTQKLFITYLPFPFWINIKVLSFLVSAASVFLFYKLVAKKNDFLSVLLLVLFVFNPYLIYNSLTVKQYTFDLLGVLMVLNFYQNKLFRKYGALFFALWCLFSNIGLFGTAAFLIFLFLEIQIPLQFSAIAYFIKKNLSLFFAPILYLIYFVWFICQRGAAELKIYMTNYWSTSFVPLNKSVFNYLLYLLHEFWLLFYNAVSIIGLVMFLISSFGIYYLFKKKHIIFRAELTFLFILLAIHLSFNVCHLYPFSDRLCLYLAPFFILLFGFSLDAILENAFFLEFKNKILIGFTALNFVCFMFYFPYKENDVVSVFSEIKCKKSENQQVFATEKAFGVINNFEKFTQNYFNKSRPVKIQSCEILPPKNALLISRVHRKIGPNHKSASEETIIQNGLQTNQILLIARLDGYNLYRKIK